MKTIILLAFFILQITVIECAYPIERDLRDITGLSEPKIWIAFMERRLWIFFLSLANGSYTSLFDLLQYMGHTQSLNAGCRYVYDKGYECWRCVMIEGNQLSTNVFGELYLDAHVIFRVQNSFNINLTVKHSMPNTNEKINGKASVRFY